MKKLTVNNLDSKYIFLDTVTTSWLDLSNACQYGKWRHNSSQVWPQWCLLPDSVNLRWQGGRNSKRGQQRIMVAIVSGFLVGHNSCKKNFFFLNPDIMPIESQYAAFIIWNVFAKKKKKKKKRMWPEKRKTLNSREEEAKAIFHYHTFYAFSPASSLFLNVLCMQHFPLFHHLKRKHK